MSDLDHIGRRPVLAGIGAAALAAVFNPIQVRAQALDRPPSVLVFDVAEACSISALRPLFQRVFGDGAAVDEWFGETILYSGPRPSPIRSCPLVSLEPECSVCWAASMTSPSAGRCRRASKGLASLPPHPDVPDSLRKLKAAGYRLVTLTDSPATPGRGPLQAAGLGDLFEQQLTAETVRRYKPARETYQMVAQATGTELSELCMIAAHPWDLIGASTAGCSAALIARAGVAPLMVPGLKQPQIIAPTLTEIAAQLVQLKHA
jgi:2-haloacid dehalogenase